MKHLTVKDLRKALEGLPDDMPLAEYSWRGDVCYLMAGNGYPAVVEGNCTPENRIWTDWQPPIGEKVLLLSEQQS